MTNEDVAEYILRNDALNKCSAFEETLYHRMLWVCSTTERVDARPEAVKAALFPEKNVRLEQVQKALRALYDAGLLTATKKGGQHFVRPTALDSRTAPHDTDSKPAKKSRPKAEAGLTAAQEERFERFWKVYPNKKSKDAARRRWKAINPDDELTEAIIGGAERAKRSREWKKDGGQYIPYPATWLHNAGWEDEVQPAEENTSLRYDDRLEDWD